MAKLPDNETLRKLFERSLSNRAIAEHYGVTVQAVNFRLAKMGLQRRPKVNQASVIIGAVWKVEAHNRTGSHHSLEAAKMLRLWMRKQLGTTLSPTSRRPERRPSRRAYAAMVSYSPIVQPSGGRSRSCRASRVTGAWSYAHTTIGSGRRTST
ncbi:hypothetical protein E4K10_18305 [Streptomyces sp. T1317-0309]|nr:hypothetical protein E4K10_18305 [Streptomyces sp. T1317-0309]